MIMAIIAVVACVCLPAVSNLFVEPYIHGVSHTVGQAITTDNLWISSILAVFVVIFLFGGLNGKSKQKRVDVYLAGVNTQNDRRMFMNSLSGESEATVRNFYLDNIFGESKFRRVGEVMCSVIIVVALVAAAIM